MTGRRGALLLLLVPALLTGCGGADQETAVPPGAAGPSSDLAGVSTPGPPTPSRTREPDAVDQVGPPLGRTALVVDYRASGGEAVQQLSLSCDPPGGTVADPARACADLAALPSPFAGRTPPIACTELYGGPQTAHITGVYRGRPVDEQVDRADGCGTQRWQQLGALLPPTD